MFTYKLISWGANSYGQLGQGVRSEQCVLPQEVDLSECDDLKPEAIRKIVGGSGHTLLLDATGRVYSCGRNDKGQAGVCGNDVSTFQKLPLPENVIDVCCGWNSSAALTQDGDLYLWGSNRHGQLGDDPAVRASTSSPVLRTVRSNEKVKRVSMGLRHTAIVTSRGNLLVTGANNKGQLGLINPETNEPCRALHHFTAGLRDVMEVACGEYHTIVAAKPRGEGHAIYSFGDNKHGQAGLDPRVCARVCPMYHPAHHDLRLDEPFQIHAGWSHTGILNDGVVYSWGRNSYSQLGREKSDNPWRIQRVERLPRVECLAVGSQHNVALTETGMIFCWGWNEHGNCGNGDTKDVRLPERVAIPRNSIGVLVGAGAGYSFAVIKLQH